ncbi:VTT domain-containing protein [Roseomonas sp. E05]|uniref:TVP38/TMEM64 family protein n=1 Tax=Roseomonas sp. E05 TaxID=3046310 RepID=UPI0024B9780E|nr:VTT domain-containing protein [Roseomonas sp. E05]MDJ0389664.1 VTT domain-containing protein [Roseomonas sp. E05]
MRPSLPLPTSARTGWKGRSPALLAAAAALFLAGIVSLPDLLSWPALAAHRAALAETVEAAPVRAALAYLGLYVAVVVLSLPGASFLTLAGGFLFGPWAGGGLAVVGASLGACLLFLLVRAAFAPGLARRSGGRLAALREELARDGFLYLLALRLFPLLPYWLVNLAPALAGMRLLPYAAATLLGIIPGTLVYAGIGAGLGSTLDEGTQPDLAALTSMRILLPLGGLALLSLGAAAWRRRARTLQAAPPAAR